MPEISRFYGIIITMYYEFGRHQQPHFHARHGDYRASFTIAPPTLLAGAIPRRQLNMILAWAEIHEAELLENWHRIEREQLLQKIEGLR
ncbi:MAG: DUF4160 domain-containing protein [Chloroflexi bacterium]|nr:DUF4160 domain-containing protein [Chloroflexota bacterium]